MIVAPEGFQEIELFDPKSIFESQGAEVIISSKGVTKAKSSSNKIINIDKKLEEISLDQFDSIIFIGGPGTTKYFKDESILNLARLAYKKQMIIGAICIAPSILANAGLLKDKQSTSFPSEKTNLEKQGAVYTGDNVTTDGNIVTASGPQAAKEFAEKITELLMK